MRFVITIGAIILLLIGVWQVQLDIRLMLFGEKAEGRVLVTRPVYSRSVSHTYVEYRFEASGGETIKSADRAWLGWRSPDDKEILIVYLPNKPFINGMSGNIHFLYWFLALVGVVLLMGQYRAGLALMLHRTYDYEVGPSREFQPDNKAEDPWRQFGEETASRKS